MGAFIIALETEDVPVPCVCDGTPHEADTVTVKRRYSGADLAVIDAAMLRVDITGRTSVDIAASTLAMMTLGVVGWSFTGATGDPVPFSSDLTNTMDPAAWSVVSEHLSAKLEAQRAPLAKRSKRRTAVS